MILHFLFYLSVVILSANSYGEDRISNSLSQECQELNFLDEYLEEIPNKAREDNYQKFVTLKGLNKVTANVLTLHSPVNQIIKFGNLEILPKICWRSDLEEHPVENKVLLEIFDIKAPNQKERVFYGWMFSSDPSVVSLEHAVYDITLLECHN